MPSVGGEAPERATSSNVQVQAQTSNSSTAGGNVEFEWKVEEGESAPPASSNANVQTTSENDTDEPEERGEKGGTEDINIGVGELQKGGVSVAAGDVNGLTEEEKQEFLLTVKTHAQVRSEQDLQNFAKGVLVEDANMEEISLNFEKIKTSYRMPAKFLGILNGSLSARTEVDAEGRVKVQYPWYSFLFKKSVSAEDLQASLDAEIEAGNEKWLRDDLASYAQVITMISNILKAKAEAVAE
jgi:hypothetical protein